MGMKLSFDAAGLQRWHARSSLRPTVLLLATLGAVLCATPLRAADKPLPAAAAKVAEPYRSESRSYDWWTRRHEDLLKRIKAGPVDLLFLGDSITLGWDCRLMLAEPPSADEGAGRKIWNERYVPKNAASIAIGGDGIQHLLWRITEGGDINGIKPRVTVLLIGVNNLGMGDPPEKVAKGIGQVIQVLQTRLPETKILLLGIFPAGPTPDLQCRAQIQTVNHLIASCEDGKRVRFLDIGKQFLDKDGVLTREIMPDFLHPSAKGYEIWAQAMQPLLDELWNESAPKK